MRGAGASRAPHRCQQRSLSLTFAIPEVEDAYLQSREAALFANVSWVCLILLVVAGVQLAGVKLLGVETVTHPEGFWKFYYDASSTACIIMLSAIGVLSRLKRAQGLLGFRGGEVLACLVRMIPIAHIIVVMGVMPNNGDESKYFRLFRATSMALTLDSIITVTHLALPIRWCVSLWLDIITVVAFCVSVIAAPVTFSLFNVLVFTGLVVGASVGGRSNELSARAQFTTIVDERTLRVQAEFAAHTKELTRAEGHPDKASPSRQSAYSTKSVASTTETGGLFNNLSGPGKRQLTSDDVRSIIDLGTREQWLIYSKEITYHPERLLGHGAQGAVFEGSFCCGPVAIKRHAARSRTVLNELRILRHVRHPNIALFHGAIISNVESWAANSITFVLEKVEGVELDIFCSRLGGGEASELHVAARKSVMMGVGQALVYLHSRTPCIVHCDLKPKNILVETRETGAFAKLLDFGLSTIVTPSATHLGGTLHYEAPEVRGDPGRRPQPSADVFSFGRVLFQVANGGASTPKALVWQPSLQLVDEWGAVAIACTSMDPSSRPAMKEVYEQTFGAIGGQALPEEADIAAPDRAGSSSDNVAPDQAGSSSERVFSDPSNSLQGNSASCVISDAGLRSSLIGKAMTSL